jgi:hypothetical protein
VHQPPQDKPPLLCKECGTAPAVCAVGVAFYPHKALMVYYANSQVLNRLCLTLELCEDDYLKSARVGYTKMLNAAVGYHIHQDPCPVQIVQPTIEDARATRKKRSRRCCATARCLAD